MLLVYVHWGVINNDRKVTLSDDLNNNFFSGDVFSETVIGLKVDL